MNLVYLSVTYCQSLQRLIVYYPSQPGGVEGECPVEAAAHKLLQESGANKEGKSMNTISHQFQ